VCGVWYNTRYLVNIISSGEVIKITFFLDRFEGSGEKSRSYYNLQEKDTNNLLCNSLSLKLEKRVWLENRIYAWHKLNKKVNVRHSKNKEINATCCRFRVLMKIKQPLTNLAVITWKFTENSASFGDPHAFLHWNNTCFLARKDLQRPLSLTMWCDL
jgi:hypothetical protein